LEAARAGEREAGEALRVETFKFRNGASTVTDLLAAEAALWTTTANRIQAEYNIVVEQARLLLAIGSLESDRFGETRP
jgi:outer membrane protein TolC